MLKEAENLDRYNETLNVLPIKKQIKAVMAVKSEKTLRRFLGEAAPEALCRRFALRYGEVMDNGFGAYERGRILFLNNDFEEAENCLNQALSESDDKRALYYLGMIRHVNGDYVQSTKYLVDAVENNIEVENSLAALGVMMHACGHQEKARNYFRQGAKVANGGKLNFFIAMLKVMDNEQEFAERELLDGMGKGDLECAEVLLSAALGEKNYQKAVTILILMISFGHVQKHMLLGEVYKQMGKLNRAAGAFQDAVDCGIKGAWDHLIDVNFQMGRFDKVEKLCKAAIDSGLIKPYGMLIRMYLQTDRMISMIRCFEDIYLKGGEEILDDLLDSISEEPPVYGKIVNNLSIALAREEKVNNVVVAKVYERALRGQMFKETVPVEHLGTSAVPAKNRSN